MSTDKISNAKYRMVKYLTQNNEVAKQIRTQIIEGAKYRKDKISKWQNTERHTIERQNIQRRNIKWHNIERRNIKQMQYRMQNIERKFDTLR